jgi:hypothetical protein
LLTVLRREVRTLTAPDEGVLVGPRVPIGDRDATWRAPVRRLLEDSGAGVGQTPDQAPNANAYAEQFVRSIRDECLNRGMPFGERPLRRILTAFVEHDHGERHHQGLGTELIDRAPVGPTVWLCSGTLRARGQLQPDRMTASGASRRHH